MRPDFLSTAAARVLGLRGWWRRAVVGDVDHEGTIATIADESGWSLRYAFMILMSAGIAVLGLLVSSPAVVIGAMLISPLMNPILGFGFALATFDFGEARRGLLALVLGALLAVAFTWLIVTLSPLKEPTSEILSRTRPNLFDLLVALFAALAGTYAIIKGREGTIVGVAIATALMPPLAVVGYGLATWNVPVLAGALALFGTNFVTIALTATVMARLYGFGQNLSGHQGWIQTVLLICVFVGLAVPLGVSLSRIAREAVTITRVRSFLSAQFGPASRVTQLAVDFDAAPLEVRSVVIAPRASAKSMPRLTAGLARRLGRPVALQVDQVLLSPATTTIGAQKAQLQETPPAGAKVEADGDRAAAAVALAAGVPPEGVIVDREHRRAVAWASVLPGAGLGAYRALEQRAAASVPGWRVTLVPPRLKLPLIPFEKDSVRLGSTGRDAVLTSAWAAKRWGDARLAVPGFRAVPAGGPGRPPLARRRGLAVADLLKAEGVVALSAPARGAQFRLALAPAPAGGPRPSPQGDRTVSP